MVRAGSSLRWSDGGQSYCAPLYRGSCAPSPKRPRRRALPAATCHVVIVASITKRRPNRETGAADRGQRLLRSYRIGPADLAESCEVTVVGANLKSVFDGKRRQVRIADDVAPELVPGHQVGQDACMSRAFPRDPGDLGFQPVRDEPGRLLWGQRV